MPHYYSIMTTTLSTDQYRQELVSLIDRFAALSGRADTSISRACFGSDQTFVGTVRAGERFTLHKAKRLEQFLRRGINMAEKDLDGFKAWVADLHRQALIPKRHNDPVPCVGAE